MLFKETVGIGVISTEDFLSARHRAGLWGHKSEQKVHSSGLTDFGDSS